MPFVTLALCISLLSGNSMADLVNLDFIKQIESTGDPDAFNEKSQARGLYQITPIVLKEWNNFFPKKQYKEEDLFKPEINKEIASWYVNDRIPQMLTHFKKPVDLKNVLISYNAGIDYVVSNRTLPKETQDYLKKYDDLSNDGYSMVKSAMKQMRTTNAR